MHFHKTCNFHKTFYYFVRLHIEKQTPTVWSRAPAVATSSLTPTTSRRIGSMRNLGVRIGHIGDGEVRRRRRLVLGRRRLKHGRREVRRRKVHVGHSRGGREWSTRRRKERTRDGSWRRTTHVRWWHARLRGRGREAGRRAVREQRRRMRLYSLYRLRLLSLRILRLRRRRRTGADARRGRQSGGRGDRAEDARAEHRSHARVECGRWHVWCLRTRWRLRVGRRDEMSRWRLRLRLHCRRRALRGARRSRLKRRLKRIRERDA